MKIRYNSPVILTFSIVVVAIQLIDENLLPQFTEALFTVRDRMYYSDPLAYFQLFSHVLGHGSWGHLFGNLTFILLLGPILEERYGSRRMLIMIGVVALFTGILNILLFTSGLLGASGVVFMLIILSSIVNMRKGEIPMTFILVATIFIGQEFLKALSNDNISQMAHIVGGVVGSIFGFLYGTEPSNEIEKGRSN